MADSPPQIPTDAPVELSVIVPCLNEELNIPELAQRVLHVFEQGAVVGELCLVDDGSTDGTAATIRGLMQTHPGVVVGCFHPQNRGIAAGWKSGAATARGKLVAIIDADLQYEPEDILRLRRELYEHSVDIVQGWRSAVGRRRDRRYTLSRGFNHLLNATFGMSLHDNKSGFLICAREVLQDLLTYKGSYFYWQSFVMVAAHAKGYSYKEIETLFDERRQGVSFLEKTAQIAALKSFFDLGKAAWEYRVTRPPADAAAQFLRRHPVVDRSPERDPLVNLKWRVYLAAFNQTHFMLTRDVEHYYETLRKTQWLSPLETRELQDEKLRRLVRHCYRNVPYYRARMHELSLRPEDIGGQDDLHKLPLLTKTDVRRHLYFDIMSETHDKAHVMKVTTSGSTGEPFICYADRAQLELRWAMTRRAEEWAGHRFGDPSVRLSRSEFGAKRLAEAQGRADAALANRTLFPVFERLDESLTELSQTLASVRPTFIDGDAEAFDFIARHLRKEASLLSCKPRGIMTYGQTLSTESRRRIEEAFGCKVFDEYGSREFSGVAYECEAHEGHHVAAEGYIVEILTDSRRAEPGEVGEIVITDLNNTCMPFLRYCIGDRAAAMDPAALCSCGRGAPRIGAVKGRAQSIIQGTDGRVVPGSFFTHCLKDFDYAFKRFEVVEEGRGAMTFRVVKGGRFSQDVLDEVIKTFRRCLGETMRIDIEFVNG